MDTLILLTVFFLFLAALLTLPYALYRGIKYKNWHLAKWLGAYIVVYLLLAFTLRTIGKAERTDFLINHASYQSQDIPLNVVPMFGKLDGIVLTSEEQGWNDKFVADITSRGASREQASQSITNGAWSWVEEGDLDTAMRRFNQAWLLHASNTRVYEGYIHLLNETGQNEYAEKIRLYVKSEFDEDI